METIPPHSRKHRRRLSFANVMSMVAVIVSMSGTSYAAVKITGSNVKDGSLTGQDIKNRSLSGTKFAAHSVDATALDKVPGVRVSISNSMPVPHSDMCCTGNIGVPVSWNVEDRDAHGMHATSTPDAITIRTAGVYVIDLESSWTFADSAERVMTSLYINNRRSAAIGRSDVVSTSGEQSIVNKTESIVELRVGDTVKVRASQYGSSMAELGSDTTLTLHWIGAGA